MDVILRRMMAVQCRTLNLNQEGEAHFEILVRKWSPGPVLVNQTRLR